MPALHKPAHCPHSIMLKKAITIDANEKKNAEKRGIPVPNFVYVLFCLQCWSINPVKKEQTNE